MNVRISARRLIKDAALTTVRLMTLALARSASASPLGVTPRQIVQLIVGRGALLVGSGIVAGAVASVALQRVMSTLLFHVSILDAATIAAIAILAATGVLACSVPALRAGRVDPLVRLRAESCIFWRSCAVISNVTWEILIADSMTPDYGARTLAHREVGGLTQFERAFRDGRGGVELFPDFH